MAAPITCAKTCCSTEILPHGVAVSLCAGIRRRSYWHSSRDNVHAHIKAGEMFKKARRGVPVQKDNKVVCHLTNNADTSSYGVYPGSAPPYLVGSESHLTESY